MTIGCRSSSRGCSSVRSNRPMSSVDAHAYDSFGIREFDVSFGSVLRPFALAHFGMALPGDHVTLICFPPAPSLAFLGRSLLFEACHFVNTTLRRPATGPAKLETRLLVLGWSWIFGRIGRTHRSRVVRSIVLG